MPRLLIVHHTPSPSVHTMLEAVKEGAHADAIQGVEVVVRAALHATATDALEADAYLLGTPANLGYISGALKHFFDEIYYPCIEQTIGRPYGVYLHGNSDTTGAERAIQAITTGLQWRLAARPVVVINQPTRADLDACWDLGATLAAGLTLNDE
jgi:NAD(P)H-dependent FMN reductase